MSNKNCSVCGKTKDSEADFYKRDNGSARGKCKECHNKESNRSRRRRKGWLSPKQKKRRSEREKERRRDLSNTAYYVWDDSRKADRKRGFENDLTKEFVETLLANKCSYCGESSIRMTLDRIDNSLGHVMANVIPACIRCNYTRGSMPYEAWKCLIPGIKRARKAGLFGAWTGRARLPKGHHRFVR